MAATISTRLLGRGTSIVPMYWKKQQHSVVHTQRKQRNHRLLNKMNSCNLVSSKLKNNSKKLDDSTLNQLSFYWKRRCEFIVIKHRVAEGGELNKYFIHRINVQRQENGKLTESAIIFWEDKPIKATVTNSDHDRKQTTPQRLGSSV